LLIDIEDETLEGAEAEAEGEGEGEGEKKDPSPEKKRASPPGRPTLGEP
jgi:hypothetical protein